MFDSYKGRMRTLVALLEDLALEQFNEYGTYSSTNAKKYIAQGMATAYLDAADRIEQAMRT